MNLLVIDDESAICAVLKLTLMKAGYSVFVCDTGPGALEILASHDIDLAIIDLSLPMINGKSVVSAVRCLRPQMPIVVITGILSTSSPYPADHPEIGPLENGFCLAKPFRPAELNRLVAGALRTQPDPTTALPVAR